MNYLSKYKSSYIAAFIDLTIHLGLLSLAYYALWYFRASYISMLTVPLLSLLNVKTFIIFHDCCHNSYTPSPQLNNVIATVLGTQIMTPPSWKYIHNTHHLSTGRLNNDYDFPHSELIFLTLKDYQKMSPFQQKAVSIVLSPYSLFTVLTYFQFLIYHRFLVINFFFKKYHSIPSYGYLLFDQLIHDLGVAGTLYLCYVNNILYHTITSVCLSATWGALLFFCQHTFNPPYIVSTGWTMKDSGLSGSSFIEIPWYLKYFTGGIEYHHIHHFNSKIPNYNLNTCHDDVIRSSTDVDNIITLSPTDCYNNLSLAVYDEENNRFLRFSDITRLKLA